MKKIYLTALSILFTVVYVNAQTITNVSPSSASAGQTLNVTITGSGTNFLPGSSTSVSFGFEQCSGTAVNFINITSNTSITANVTMPSGYFYSAFHDVEVYDFPDGYMVKDHTINITGGDAYPISLSPNSGNPGQTLNVSITGTGTHFTQNSGTVWVELDLDQRVCFTDPNTFTANVSSNTFMTASFVIPALADTGYYDLSVHGSADNFGRMQNLFHVTAPAAVNELENEYHFRIAPNPFSSFTTLTYTPNKPDAVTTEVFDIFGRKIFSHEDGRPSPGTHTLKIDAAELNLSSGIYYLRFAAGGRSITKKILLSR